MLSICFASVAKLIQGSRKLNNAHDLALKFKKNCMNNVELDYDSIVFTLKLIPWKQASEMLVPCNSIVPPKTMPVFGSGTLNVESIRPIAF